MTKPEGLLLGFRPIVIATLVLGGYMVARTIGTVTNEDGGWFIFGRYFSSEYQVRIQPLHLTMSFTEGNVILPVAFAILFNHSRNITRWVFWIPMAFHSLLTFAVTMMIINSDWRRLTEEVPLWMISYPWTTYAYPGLCILSIIMSIIIVQKNIRVLVEHEQNESAVYRDENNGTKAESDRK